MTFACITFYDSCIKYYQFVVILNEQVIIRRWFVVNNEMQKFEKWSALHGAMRYVLDFDGLQFAGLNLVYSEVIKNHTCYTTVVDSYP
jgi:hypothetical protein